jgi:uncharacterized protein (DUF885 family)
MERFHADRESLNRWFPVDYSPQRTDLTRRFLEKWLSHLDRIEYSTLTLDGKIDFQLFRNHLRREQHNLQLAEQTAHECEPLVPFAAAITGLEESRRRMEPLDPPQAAGLLNDLSKRISDLLKQIADGFEVSRIQAYRAAKRVDALQSALKTWFEYYNGYDPLFTWWVAEPYKALDESLRGYASEIREKLAGIAPGDTSAIIGEPLGRDALVAELTFEMIPYAPEELVEIAVREFTWCETEMRRASREMGFGDDYQKAIEHVKTLHAAPGDQPALIRDLALEAIRFVEERDLVSVPPLAKETWRMEMMSPERQKVNPFFLGGESIIVSYPTNTMSHDQKRMSMRGNNPHFARATVQHELIPGHHLQLFMLDRHRTWRKPFETPFWIEGWALYWEMLLWDSGFPRSPEDRVGMLFWRMHRCARILFSLSFHLETMTPGECIELLVERVGHERDNAEAEVRRSFGGDYPPLYQCAYMIGGLQMRALRRELVDGGRMSERDFHDEALRHSAIPIELLRAALTGNPPQREFASSWRFYERLR